MFRKLIKISPAIIIFCLIASMQLAKAEEAGEKKENKFISEKVYEIILHKINSSDSQGGISEGNLNLQTVFEKNKGQNLYLAAYRQQQVGPLNKIIAKLSQNYTYFNTKTQKDQQLSEAQVRDFVLNKTIDPALSDGSLVGVQKMLNAIEANFNNELEIEALRSKWESYAMMDEMFINADTSDSGFDLVVDLEIIETILFREPLVEEYEVEGSSQENSSSDDLAAYIPTSADLKAQEDQNNKVKTSTTDNKQNDSEQNTSNNEASNTTKADEPSVANTKENINANICFADSALQNTITDYINEEQINPEKENNESAQSDQKANKEPQTNTTTETETSTESSTEEQLANAEDKFNNLKPEEGANWNADLPCYDHFCLTISLQNNDDEEDIKVFKKEDNCIACHIKFIYENFYKLSASSLTPNKVSGNFGEAPICKQAANEVEPSINITLVKKPIESPLLNDLILSQDSIKDQLKEIYALPLSLFKPKNPTPLTTDEQAKKNIKDPNLNLKKQITQTMQTEAGEKGVSLSDLQGEIDYQVKQIETEIRQKAELKLTESAINASAEGFKAIEYEMTIMNGLFDDFLMTMQTLINGSGNACEKLNNKKNCP